MAFLKVSSGGSVLTICNFNDLTLFLGTRRQALGDSNQSLNGIGSAVSSSHRNIEPIISMIENYCQIRHFVSIKLFASRKMDRRFLNSSVTDLIKFTRTADFEVAKETSITIAFLDQVWKVDIKSQRTRYWTFSIKIWLKSCPSDGKEIFLSGWIVDDTKVNDGEDDWTDPATRPHFKLMRKLYEPGDDAVDPLIISPEREYGERAQIRIVFELYHENLRHAKVEEENNVIDKLFASKIYYDVTIETKDGVIRAHKWILKLKSKYFEALFDNKLTDKDQDHFKIQDITSVVLNEIFRYIYTGKIHDFEALAYDILVWSDFFAIDDLRDLSTEYVLKSLTPENVIHVLELAVNSNQGHLKKESIKFFKKNMNQVVASKSWLKVYKNLPSSVQEVIKLLMR